MVWLVLLTPHLREPFLLFFRVFDARAFSLDSAGSMTGMEECAMAIGTLANGGFPIAGVRGCVAVGRQKEVDEQGS
jgi:hypothetical protein